MAWKMVQNGRLPATEFGPKAVLIRKADAERARDERSANMKAKKRSLKPRTRGAMNTGTRAHKSKGDYRRVKRVSEQEI